MQYTADSILSIVCSGLAVSAERAQALCQGLPGGLLDILAAAGAASSAGGSSPFTCGIINAKSGCCSEDCAFCAQSQYHTTTATVYPLVGEDKLLEHAEFLVKAGVSYMGLVTSGLGPSPYDFEKICRAAGRISQKVGIKLCVSLGLLEEGQALALKQAGVTSYHHNLETARSYYGRVCTTHSYESRVETIKRAAAAGLRTCSGGIFGLGEGWPQRLELAETLRELNVDSIPVNFLTPIAGTVLEDAPGLPVWEALAVIAIFRLMHPKRDIVVCGGRARTLKNWENCLYFAGANGMMVGDYLTAKGSLFEKDMGMLRTLGLTNHA